MQPHVEDLLEGEIDPDLVGLLGGEQEGPAGVQHARQTGPEHRVVPVAGGPARVPGAYGLPYIEFADAAKSLAEACTVIRRLWTEVSRLTSPARTSS